MQRTKLDKKGVLSLRDAAPVVIILMTIGIIMTVGLLIMAEVQDSVIDFGSLAISTTVGNETHATLSAGTALTLDLITTSQIARSVALINVTNATGPGDVVPTTNYTFDAAAGTVTPDEPTDSFPGGYNISYTLGETSRSIALNGTISSQEGLDTLATFQSIFGIIVAAAIVLGVILLFR